MSTSRIDEITDTRLPQDGPAPDLSPQEARQLARQWVGTILRTAQTLSLARRVFVVSLLAVSLCTLLFDMVAFRVATPGRAISETMADAQRTTEARLNALSYSAWDSSGWGKLMWVCSLAAIGVTAWSLYRSTVWVPLAEAGLAVAVTGQMLLLRVVGFPDLSAWPDATASATLLGYWLPLTCAVIACVCAILPLLNEEHGAAVRQM